MKTLIIQTRPGIGDLCVFLPAIHEMAKNNITLDIDIITKKRTAARETLKHDPYIKNIFFLDDLQNSNLNLLHFIKNNSYEIVYIFHYGIRYPIICKLAGVKKIYSYGWFKKRESIVEKSQKSCREWLNNTQLKFPYKIYRPALTTKKNNIILGIGGSGPTKKWPTEKFIKLINQISNIKEYAFLLAGGPEEQPIAAQLINALPNIKIISTCDKNIEKSINLIEDAKLYIGNDTGFMHLSAGLGIPSFGLFGDTPSNYADYTNKITSITPENISVVTHGSLAMNQISVDCVMLKIKETI